MQDISDELSKLLGWNPSANWEPQDDWNHAIEALRAAKIEHSLVELWNNVIQIYQFKLCPHCSSPHCSKSNKKEIGYGCGDGPDALCKALIMALTLKNEN